MPVYDLEERTLAFSKSVVAFCRKLPRNIENNEIIKQVVRSACSIGANYREANSSLGPKDFGMRIKICRKESKETHYWLLILLDGNELFSDKIKPLAREAEEFIKIFSTILARAK